jgi:hypothetical protein
MVPSFISLKIHSGPRVKLRLWLPIFILWPFFLVLVLLLAPFLYIAEIISIQRGMPIRFFCLLGGVIAILSSLRGTKVKIDSPGKQAIVHVTIY